MKLKTGHAEPPLVTHHAVCRRPRLGYDTTRLVEDIKSNSGFGKLKPTLWPAQVPNSNSYRFNVKDSDVNNPLDRMRFRHSTRT